MRLLQLAIPLIAAAAAIHASDSNPPAIRAKIHEISRRTQTDGSINQSQEKWGKFYRAADGSTLTVFYDQADGSPINGFLYDAQLGQGYQVNYAKGVFTSNPKPTGQNLPSGAILVLPGTMPPRRFNPNAPVQTVNGVQCSAIPVKVRSVQGEINATGSACQSWQFSIAVKTEITIQTDAGTGYTLIEYLDLAPDTEQHDPSFFRIPAGFTEVPPVLAKGPAPQ